MATLAPPRTRRLRILTIYYALWVAVALGFAAVCSPFHFAYDFSMLRAVVGMALAAQAAWLLWRRARGAKSFCLVATAVTIALSVIDLFFLGAFGGMAARIGMPLAVAAVGAEYAAGAAVIWLLATGGLRLRSDLCVCLDMHSERPRHTWNLPWRERVRTWAFWRDVAIYFIVFSFVGHWAEMLFCQLIKAGVFMGGFDASNAMLWDQWLFPFSAEGTALAMVVIALHPLKEWLLRKFDGRVRPALAWSFLANAAVCTAIDFGTGMVANQHFELWDYRDMPFNFMGQVCLQNSLVYSIAATIVVWLAYPAMDRAIRRMPKAYANALFVSLAGIYAFEALLHFVDLGL